MRETIERLARGWFQAKKAAAAKVKRDRSEFERISAEAELVLDEMKENGLTLDSDLGKAVFAEEMTKRAKALGLTGQFDEDAAFKRRMSGTTF